MKHYGTTSNARVLQQLVGPRTIRALQLAAEVCGGVETRGDPSVFDRRRRIFCLVIVLGDHRG